MISKKRDYLFFILRDSNKISNIETGTKQLSNKASIRNSKRFAIKFFEEDPQLAHLGKCPNSTFEITTCFV